MSNIINIEAERLLTPHYDLIRRTCNVTKKDVRKHLSEHTYLEQVMCAQDIINYALILEREYS